MEFVSLTEKLQCLSVRLEWVLGTEVLVRNNSAL